jgi:predicted acylesterase/phospholipase RssA
MAQHHVPPQIEMRLDGGVIPPTPSWPLRLAGAAIVVAVLAGVIAVAALAFWLAVALVPVAIVAGLVAWAAIRFQLWRARRSGRDFGGGGDLFTH